MIRVADYVAQFLVSKEVENIFVLTGNGAMYLNDGIVSQPKLSFYCARHETAATLMAESYARLKQSLGAVCVTSGPGAANAVSGLVEAWVDAAPIMVISGQVQRSHTSRNANIPGLRTFGNAEIDIVSIVDSITKYSVMVNDPQLIRYHLEKAYFMATTGRPGPVWIDIPMDVQSAKVDPKSLVGYIPELSSPTTTNLDDEIDSLINYLKNSQHPLIVAGQGIRNSGTIKQFKKLISQIKAPVMLSRLGLDILPFSEQLNMGLGGIKGQRYCKAISTNADLIIALGNRLSVPFVGYKFNEFAPNAKIVMVDIERSELIKPGVKVDLAINSDLSTFLPKLSNKLSKTRLPSYRKWLKHCQRLKKKNPMVTSAMKKNPMDLYYFMSRINALSNKDSIFITDAGSNYYVGGQVYHFENGEREITSGSFAAMGLTVPLAIGASVAEKNKQILAVTGDGSIELNIQELKTISYYNLNIKLFVINNGGYVSMRNWQDNFFEGRRIGSDDDTGAETLTFEKVAAAFSLPFIRIETWEEADEKIKDVMKHKNPVLIEVITDSNQKIVEPIEDLAY